MKRNLLLCFLIIASQAGISQNNQPPCSAPEASQFDFWVGSWNLYTADTLTGTNTIYKIMDGCTVQENFENSKAGYSGKSWSMYDPKARLWQQTWVDNQGSFIYLTGKFEEGKMTLFTQPKKIPSGKELIYRMLFSNISKDSFDWDWDSSTDNGATWKSGWHIHYTRRQ
ncbi:MAG: DUF1579 family protein [Bacteroidetes bacterium]|nr:DUF1579 family protein [Bacteroidota bacterium]